MKTPLAEEIAAVRSSNTFNPYSDRCDVCDRAGAPARRLQMLRSLLRSAEAQQVDSFWIGRDLGFRGGRRTGLALTDDCHIRQHGERWHLAFSRPTQGQAVKERTASVIWGQLSDIDARIFLWNVFPFHPHHPGDAFSNRAHNAAERRIGLEILNELIKLLRPKHVVCIGSDAANSVERLRFRASTYKVRHPSYGGQSAFCRQIAELYEV